MNNEVISYVIPCGMVPSVTVLFSFLSSGRHKVLCSVHVTVSPQGNLTWEVSGSHYIDLS
jgi:hypothetical protein